MLSYVSTAKREVLPDARSEFRAALETAISAPDPDFVVPDPSRTMATSSNAIEFSTHHIKHLEEPIAPIRLWSRDPRLPTAQQEQTTILQTLEGVVTSELSDRGEFEARLNDVTNPAAAEEAGTFSVEEVTESDRRLIAPGAVFYWLMGSERSRFGQLTRISRIRFRRLPQWTRQQLHKVDERAKSTAKLFGIDY